MSLLKKPHELSSSIIYKGLIYGVPGIGKTSLALSSKNPVCIDFDKGMQRVEPIWQKDSLPVETYQECLNLLNSKEIDSYDTIIIDTLGKCVDRIADHIAKLNPRLRQSDGQMTMKGWGAMKNAFNNLFKLLESKNKSILFVAHESEEKDGENIIKRPDCVGSARKDIIKELDFMGYMEVSGNKRTITFSPSDRFYAKNSLGLDGQIQIPDTADGNTFIIDNIVKRTEQRLTQGKVMREQYNAAITLMVSNIEKIYSIEELEAYKKQLAIKDHVWDSKLKEDSLLAEKERALSWVFPGGAFVKHEGKKISEVSDKEFLVKVASTRDKFSNNFGVAVLELINKRIMELKNE